MTALPSLTLLEARVLGVLVEKQHTVPDSYPLTLNALVTGCNQKTSRDPVLEASEAEVRQAVDRLRPLSLVIESSGGRVMRYAQNVGKVLGVPPQSVALLAVLFLRGPQTAGELRIHSERLHRFGDILSVEAFLRELAERREGPLVKELPRQPGTRETRWTHLLSGEAPGAAADSPRAPSASGETDPGGRRWRSASGENIACVEKLKVLRENLDEIRGLCQDALDDAVLMGCDESQFRAAVLEVIGALKSAYSTLESLDSPKASES